MAGNKMAEHDGTAKVAKMKSWSPEWSVPIVTALMGSLILVSHSRHQGPEVPP